MAMKKFINCILCSFLFRWFFKRRTNVKIFILIISIILYTLFYFSISTKYIKNHGKIYDYAYNYLSLENEFCKYVNLSHSDETANFYMSKERNYTECDILNGTEFVTIKDVLCESSKETRQLCNSIGIKLDVIYSMRLNINEFLLKVNLEEDQVDCNVEIFDKVFNSKTERKTQTLKIFQFSRESNHTLYFDTHGFYQVSCYSNDKTTLYEDYYFIYPYNMSKLMDKRQKNKKKLTNDDKKMNVLMIRIDSMSYQHIRRVMPKTYDFLTNKLENNIMYTMFSTVGENTHPNIMPLYSGIVVEAIESRNVSSEIEAYKKIDKGYYDNFPFIWYEYEKEGYITGFQVC
jgi:hypothetical protein